MSTRRTRTTGKNATHQIVAPIPPTPPAQAVNTHSFAAAAGTPVLLGMNDKPYMFINHSRHYTISRMPHLSDEPSAPARTQRKAKEAALLKKGKHGPVRQPVDPYEPVSPTVWNSDAPRTQRKRTISEITADPSQPSTAITPAKKTKHVHSSKCHLDTWCTACVSI